MLLFLCNICNHGDQSSQSRQFLILPLFHGDAGLQRRGRFSAVICDVYLLIGSQLAQRVVPELSKCFISVCLHVDVWLLLSKPWNIHSKESVMQHPTTCTETIYSGNTIFICPDHVGAHVL